MKTYGDEVSPDIQNAKQILRWVKDGTLGREFTLRDIYRPQRAGIRDKETAHRGVDVLVDFGWIRRCDRRLGSGQTRSTVPFGFRRKFVNSNGGISTWKRIGL